MRRGSKRAAEDSNVVLFPHARTSSGRAGVIPKTDGSACLPTARSASDTTRNFSGAIRPRAFQLLTADGPMPQSSATLAGPPSASRTSSIVRSMDSEYSRIVELSTFHVLEMVTNCGPCLNYPMISERDFRSAVGLRVRLLRATEDESQAAFGERISVGDTAIAMYEGGQRLIPPYEAILLKQQLGSSLEWLYAGEETLLTDVFKQKLAKARLIVAEEAGRPARGRKPRAS